MPGVTRIFFRSLHEMEQKKVGNGLKTDDGVIGMKYEWLTMAYSWNSKRYCSLRGQCCHCRRETMANTTLSMLRVTLSDIIWRKFKQCLHYTAAAQSLPRVGGWGEEEEEEEDS